MQQQQQLHVGAGDDVSEETADAQHDDGGDGDDGDGHLCHVTFAYASSGQSCGRILWRKSYT